MTNKERINILNTYPDILLFEELVEILNVGENTTYNLLQNKKIYSKKIGREYKIPKLCVIDYLLNTSTDKSYIFQEYGDILDFKEVRKMLRNPGKNTLYNILRKEEIYYKIIANEYKIPKSSVIEYIFKDYTSAL